jgi:hypothetical protein
VPDPESVAQEAIVQEPVRDEQGGGYHKQVEELAEDESKVVDVVLVVDVGTKELEREKNVKK